MRANPSSETTSRTVSRICVYSGSSFGASPEYAAVAAAFGTACATRGLTIIYGGGGVGLMGVLADSALAAGGHVIGVIPRAMIAEERAHHNLTELIAVDTMHERKHRMAQLADAFVALPGGIGTLEEIVEVFTWLQLGLHLKPVGILNALGFYELLLKFLDHMRTEQFLTAAHQAMLSVSSNPDSLIDQLALTQHVHVPKPVHNAVNTVKER
ncbi:MAG: TIGR00730 family Rossman fold protein [Verrucomicrobia bacterium]|nr:TIGR00730 family Rossman fold protein [Verrucomicrobiota bacterium]